MADAVALRPLVGPRRSTPATVAEGHGVVARGTGRGRVVADVAAIADVTG